MPLVIGLNSGTSADGIDAIAVRLEGSGRDLSAEPLAALTIPYPASLGAALRAAPHVPLTEAASWHRSIGEEFARAAEAVAAAAGRPLSAFDCIGSHGQTVFHAPECGLSSQLGEADCIAERTGLDVWFDFRARDLAAGGEGAPLSPWLDWVTAAPGDVVLNLGGIANATFVRERFLDCRASDLGPANLPLDTLVALHTKGKQSYDADGRIAASGQVRAAVLDALFEADDFLARPLPKSTGRERYGAPFCEKLMAAMPGASIEDLLATATAYVVRALCFGLGRLCAEEAPRRLIVAGGGLANPVLMAALASQMPGTPVEAFTWRGIGSRAREALLFAVLAHEARQKTRCSLPAATGAKHAVVLGKCAFGARP